MMIPIEIKVGVSAGMTLFFLAFLGAAGHYDGHPRFDQFVLRKAIPALAALILLCAVELIFRCL